MSRTPQTLDIADARNRVYDLLDDSSLTVGEQQRRALTVGCRYLGIEEAHIKRIDDPEKGAVVTATNSDAELVEPGMEVDELGFCTHTIEQDRSLAIADAAADYEDNPGFTDHGIACYLGATITVDGERYGTVCFSSRDPRDRSFSPEERTFVELLANIFGRRIAEVEFVEAFRRAQSKYRTLSETATDSLFLVDSESGTIAETNGAAAALLETTEEALVDSEYADIHPEDHHEWFDGARGWLTDTDERREFLPNGSRIYIEAPDGRRPVALDAELVELDGRDHYQIVLRDIEDRRRRERRAKAIFDQTHQFTGLLAPDGTLLEANETALEFAGVDREDVVGKHFTDAPWWDVDEETRAKLRDALERAAAGEFVRYETPVSGVTGESVIDFSIRPITDDEGRVELLIPEGRDVTARVERDRQLSVLSRVLRHNFRNDISVINGFADGLARGVVEDTEEAAVEIERHASQLSELVDRYREGVDLLNDPPDTTQLTLTETVREVVDDHRNEYPDATITLDGGTDVIAEVIPQIDRVLEELLTNAVVHTGETPTVSVGLDASHESVTLTVADDGPGLPDPEVNVLTGDQSVDPLGHANGMDLWLVYWIVDLSDGQVEVETDDGTEIRITLPAATDESRPTERAVTPSDR